MTAGPILTLGLFTASAAAAEGPDMKRPLPSYAHAIRCAGLAEAASQGAEAPRDEVGRKMFDVAMFWGMAASEVGRRDGVPAAKFTADQNIARARATGDFAAADGAAAELEACVAETPPIDR